jgi:hypothetical protein
MTQTPSSGAGATPNPGSPATGTPASGATPPAAALTLEDALKKIAELEQHAQNKTEEASRHGNRLTAAEKELAAYKAAEEAAKAAQMSELEKAQKLHADLQEQHEALAAELFEARVFQDVARYADKFNFNVSADTLMRFLLMDEDAIEFEEGKPTNIEKLLSALAKNEPGLVKQSAVTPNSPVVGTPTIPAMNPGRSSIASPGQSVPGRIPSWNEIYKRP